MLRTAGRSALICYYFHNTFSNVCRSGLLVQNQKYVSTLHVKQSEVISREGSFLPNLVGLDTIDPEYLQTYTDLIQDLLDNEAYQELNEAKQRLVNVLKHTIPYGRQFEGLGVIDNYKLIESPENLTPKNINLAHILSWCNALLCASYIIEDDIMDNEETRKGLPCWHTLDNIGLTAVNDSMLVQSSIFVILKKYFSKHHSYLPVIELIHATNHKIALGQAIDVSCKINGKPRYEVFTRERVQCLGEYKSACFCYEFPLKLALFLAGKYDRELHRKAAKITSKIGMIFMVHNDAQDSLGDFTVIGKNSTDISNGRCTWLAVEALEKSTPSQRQRFMQHYGRSCNQSVQIIHDLYKELRLTETYLEFEKKILSSIYEEVEEISHLIPKEVFVNLLSDVTLYRHGYCYTRIIEQVS